jgi:hypothetical protein
MKAICASVFSPPRIMPPFWQSSKNGSKRKLKTGFPAAP